METLEIKTVEQLSQYYDAGKLWGWSKIINLDENNSPHELWRGKQHYHNETFIKCSYGTQVALINDFMFNYDKFSMGHTNFTHPKCKEMLNEFLEL